MIGFGLVGFSPAGGYARISMFASTAILLVAMLCVTAVFPPKEAEPVAEEIPDV